MEKKVEKCFSIYGIGNKYTEKLLESLVRFIRILMQLPWDDCQFGIDDRAK